MIAWRSWFRKRRQQQPELVTVTDAGCAGALAIHLATDVGNVRSNNEDRAAAVYPPDEYVCKQGGVMLVLADGMGGHNSGEVASRMAVEIVSQAFFGGNGHILDRLKAAFRKANAAIYEAGQMEENSGMGTTCTAAVALGHTIYVAHVGDSRAYHMGQGRLTRLTADQTYVQYLVQNGMLGQAEAMNHPKRNLLTQALGASETVTPALSEKAGSLAPGDAIVLCSDGLYEYLSDDEIASYLSADLDKSKAAQDMVDEAKRRGGHDNITVLLGYVTSDGGNMGWKPTKEMPQENTSNT